MVFLIQDYTYGAWVEPCENCTKTGFTTQYDALPVAALNSYKGKIMRITFDLVKEANIDLPDTHDWAFVDGKLECYARAFDQLNTNFKVAIRLVSR